MEKILLILLTALSLNSCNSDKTCKYETEYQKVSESMKDLLKYDKENAFGKEPLTKDVTSMPCSDFQKKYNLSDKDLKITLQSMKTSVLILETFKNIEENVKSAEQNYPISEMKKRELAVRDSLTDIALNGTPTEQAKAKKELEKFENEYSFNKKDLKLVDRDDNIEVEVLEAAFDSKKVRGK